MDFHLEGIPSLTPLPTRCLPCGDFQTLGWDTDWTLDAQVLALGSLDELLADLFEALNLARCQGNANPMHFLQKTTLAVSVSSS